jgi:hypothetical protein
MLQHRVGRSPDGPIEEVPIVYWAGGDLIFPHGADVRVTQIVPGPGVTVDEIEILD